MSDCRRWRTPSPNVTRRRSRDARDPCRYGRRIGRQDGRACRARTALSVLPEHGRPAASMAGHADGRVWAVRRRRDAEPARCSRNPAARPPTRGPGWPAPGSSVSHTPARDRASQQSTTVRSPRAAGGRPGASGGRYRASLSTRSRRPGGCRPFGTVPSSPRPRTLGHERFCPERLALVYPGHAPARFEVSRQEGSNTSVVRHVGRRSGRTYETPVVAVRHDDSFLIALPYGKRTDWPKNVLDKGSATIVTNGHTYEVDRYYSPGL